MEIEHIDNQILKNFPAGSSCDINCLHIKIKDFKPIVQEFETYISDTSWINNLDEISKKVYKVNAEKTIDKIVTDIIGGITTNVNQDIGEFIVSYSAQLALEIKFYHHLPP